MADLETSTPTATTAPTTTTTTTTAENGLEAALRTQVTDLLTQVTQLNSKLVSSYDRISDLEDELHVSSHQLRQHTLKISEMELEREKHRSMIEGGLLVEKAHVTQELTRLMVEASLSKSRGEEERKGKERMEKELDDLSAGLFEQANTMVKEARIEKAKELDLREKAEHALACSEEHVRSLEGKLGQLTTELELSQAGRAQTGLLLPQVPVTRHLLSTTQPYTEFLLFIAHLRGLHPASPSPPSMSTLLSLPWMARLSVEDVDPTLRLDLAPSLNWLSRRSGGLTVESVSPSFFSEHANAPTCGLCGHQIFDSHASNSREPSSPWRIDRFRKTIRFPSDRISIATTASSKYSSPPPTPPRVPSPPLHSNASILSKASSTSSQVYIFRIPTQLPSQTSNSSHNPTQTYALCSSNTCLARLRTTLALFTFVRNDVVGEVWREEIPELAVPELPTRNPSRQNSRPSIGSLVNGGVNSSPPPVPPRKRSLWGTMTGAWERVAAPASPTRPAPPIRKSVTSPPELKSPTPKPAALPPLPVVEPVPPPLPQRSGSRRKSAPVPPKNEQDHVKKDDEVLFDHDDHEHEHGDKTNCGRYNDVQQARRTIHGRPETPQTEGEPQSTALEEVKPEVSTEAAQPDEPTEKVKLEATSEGGETKVDGPSTKEEKSGDEDDFVDAPESGSSPTSPEPAPAVDTSTPAPNEENSSLDAAQEPSDEAKPENEQIPPVVADSENPHITSSPSPQPPEEDRAVTPTPASPLVSTKSRPTTPLLDELDPPEPPKGGVDPGLHISSRTWEERTWKELVRLREEMWWARVGGVLA
ncbi:hypothetical protein DL96DRAFT_1554982 [Flagelloscypha sp. PMI_526]|nr:hypothetical protein DL96DRAFT_1554982 [Flagelloscypha sp. PMI_526]